MKKKRGLNQSYKLPEATLCTVIAVIKCIKLYLVYSVLTNAYSKLSTLPPGISHNARHTIMKAPYTFLLLMGIEQNGTCEIVRVGSKSIAVLLGVCVFV